MLYQIYIILRHHEVESTLGVRHHEVGSTYGVRKDDEIKKTYNYF